MSAITDYRADRTAPARPPADAVMSQEGQQNAGGARHQVRDSTLVYYDSAPLSEYPRMMYRATNEEKTQEWADAIHGIADKPMVINNYDGLLCETTIAHDADEAEALSTNGWDITPKAAHGITDGLQAVTSAKDDRIAELEAMLAAQTGGQVEPSEPQRRGPGRPPKEQVTG